MNDSPRPAVPARAAVYIAWVQFLFVTTWTVYVLFLPRLLESAGLPLAWTPWILLLDQAVFMVADLAAGVAADRVQRTLGRLGPLIVGCTAISCVAFLLLPHAVRFSHGAVPWALVFLLLWTATSSALRAPLWALLGKYAARPSLPWLNALTLVGIAAAGAVSSYLGIAMRDIDPRLPFALSSLALLAATAGMVYVEHRLAALPAAAGAGSQAPGVLESGHVAWAFGVLLLASAFQAHLFLNAPAQYLRFVPPGQIEELTPLFWLAFGVGMIPGGALCRRLGALRWLAIAAFLGAGGALAAATASSLDLLIAAQLAVGVAWGGMLVAMLSSAAEVGRGGREGLTLGAMFAMLALAAIARLAMVVAAAPKHAVLGPALPWVPIALWAAGGLVVSQLARASRGRRRSAGLGGAAE